MSDVMNQLTVGELYAIKGYLAVCYDSESISGDISAIEDICSASISTIVVLTKPNMEDL